MEDTEWLKANLRTPLVGGPGPVCVNTLAGTPLTPAERQQRANARRQQARQRRAGIKRGKRSR